MHIEVRTDSNIAGGEGLTERIEELVRHALARFGDHITTLEVHLSDANAGKGGQDDKHCVIEARLEGRRPTAVKHEAATVEKAAKGAADKLKRSLETILGKLRDGH
ncbi:MAG: HPF/RaiA family ribosome-associated protein [Proteobacteria bacterium]|nr:HPF/RaiA family ribosome-associated protein [Pseudomonadota bacterium]